MEMHLRSPVDPLVDDSFEFSTVPTHIGLFAVDDKGGAFANLVSDLFPQTQGRLSINEADLDAMTVQAGNFSNAL